MNSVTTSVEGFRSASFHKDPLVYPGERPVGSYVTDGDVVSGLRVEATENGLGLWVEDGERATSLDDYLAARGAQPMAQRIPVLAYGANMCPASLKSKFAKAGRASLQVVPTAYTTLGDSDIVWSGSPGINGNFIANLYSGREVEGTSVQAGVSFLTREQVLIMHATELNYQLVTRMVQLAGVEMPAYYYAGQDSMFLDDGNPVAVASIPAEQRHLTVRSNPEMLRMMLENAAVMSDVRTLEPSFPEGMREPQAYIDFVRSLRPSPDQKAPKRAFKLGLHAILAEQGLIRTIDVATSEFASWANPSTLTGDGDVYVLPTSELAKGDWPDQAARDKVLHGITEHFYRHYDPTDG